MNGPTVWLRDRLPDEPRLFALLSVALVLGAPLRTMYHLTDVVGSPTLFLVLVALALAGATLIARVLRPGFAIAIGAVLFTAGIAWYVTNLSTDPELAALVRDTIALVTGRSLLQIANVRLWVLSFAPAPVFLTWYFALRRWYVTATVSAGTTLAFFVLTTDAGLVTTLLGVVGAVATLGFGNLDVIDEGTEPAPDPDTDGSADGIDASRRAVLEQLAAVIIVPSVVSTIPSVTGSSLSFTDDTDGPTIETSLINADETLSVQGDISLTPTVRFTVESDEPRYWRVAAYDRYTGDGWVRTGSARSYGGRRLSGPDGDSRTLRQSFEVESAIATAPGAWKAVRYRGDPDFEVTAHDGFQPAGELSVGDSYEVTSEVLLATPQQLRDAGTDYPDQVRQRYLQLPDSTPDRVRERTTTLTSNAENPYETALVVEQWLENNREYSLEVDRPDRNVADRFLFEMDRGYCVYFATTMVVMLRTQGIPARLTVGYTPGERVDEERWVVRGLNSHAWVEVYFPEQGWVRFDPTPTGPREQAEQSELEDARSAAVPNVDTGQTGSQGFSSTPTPTPPPLTETDTNATTDTGATPTPLQNNPDTPSGPGNPGAAADGIGSDIDLPSREEATLGVVALLGVAAGARRSGLSERLYRAVWVRYQRRVDPETDVERAFQRVLYVLGRRNRQRRDGETVRAYLDAIDADQRVRRLAQLRERARYGGRVDEATADTAVELADEVVSEQ
ncbi:transglutaminase TgpA family protein [Haloarcula halophila]|uniref:transglutaminase TgpA family protein n=1 Tax=Haloarcula TaxID=2237 RepID=UPI0023E3FC14|nr:transglutaminase domain-containing protein [Halomicroarcula sp. DFY41]